MSNNLQTDSTFVEFEYFQIEDEFKRLLNLVDLDNEIARNPEIVESFESGLEVALFEAYKNDVGCPKAHLLLQRILYLINRMKLFWYDGFENYVNEDSIFLYCLRLKIQKAWEAWEELNIEDRHSDFLEIELALRGRVDSDLKANCSLDGLFIRDEISTAGYKRLLAITSLDGLVEASQLSRMLGGVGNEVQTMLTRILWEEYGSGKFERKHSTHFIKMLEECGMNSNPETYFELVPWEVLSVINFSFLLSEHKRNFLRYIGGLLFTEISVPSSFQNIKMAGERLNMGEVGVSYWNVHIKEDIRHGKWMLDDVALPLVEKYPELAWNIVKGYDQQKFISKRSTSSILESIRQMELSHDKKQAL